MDFSFTKGLGSGIYTSAQLQQNKDFRVAHSSRKPVLAEATNAAVKTADSWGNLGPLISEDHMEKLSNSLSYYLYPAFHAFGTAWHYFSALLMLGLMIKIVSGCVWRAHVLYLERGVGLWLLGALWSTAFLMVRTPLKVVDNAFDAITTAMHEPMVPNVPPAKNQAEGVRYSDLRIRLHDMDDEEQLRLRLTELTIETENVLAALSRNHSSPTVTIDPPTAPAPEVAEVVTTFPKPRT